jgi:predicted transposase YdaD
MKTDFLFHVFFQLAPQALFELLQIEPGCAYRFESPVVKATERRMDGILEPAEAGFPRYFIEVQGYSDKAIYWRALHQISLYHAQRPELNATPWQLVLLFLDSNYDPGPETLGPLQLPGTDWLVRGSIPELLRQVPKQSAVLNVLRPLITEKEELLREQATQWVTEIQLLTAVDQAGQERLLDLLSQFIIQKFSHLNRKEVAIMLKLTPIRETVAGREWIQEGQISVLSGIIEAKFGIPKSMSSKSLEELTVETLDELGEEILKIDSVDELATWIEEHIPRMD